MVIILLLNVPACRHASLDLGLKPSIISERPPNPPNDTPPPKYFPKVIKSGLILSSPCIPPGASLDVITSSKIKRLPASLVHCLRHSKNSFDAGMQPLDPIIGSTITHARSDDSRRIISAAASGLLYGTNTMSNGAFMGEGAPK